ncbi:MAG: S-methyl-5'-thioadenosine phosphorylase [Rickettsiales bacterium]|nr:S-methyl-5'-thioadenosine phosphorylase [Rickettsiales bacterium]
MLALIGGTGLYQIDGIEVIDEIEVKTPFGAPSSLITKGAYQNQTVFFMPRHGKNHELLPHEVNYRANIWAFKSLGVKQIIGVSAIGSLKEELAPGDFVIPSQYFDFVKGNREKTFFGNGLAAHVSTAEPTCSDLTQSLLDAAKRYNSSINVHTGKTYACVDGPRLGTKAESFFLIQAGCDVVGMTNVPEVFLAREAQICYATLGIVTDYDCWKDNPGEHVTVEAVIQRYGSSLAHAKSILQYLLQSELPNIDETYRKSLACAVLSQKESLSSTNKELLELLSA